MMVKRQHGITATEYYTNLVTIIFTSVTHDLMPTPCLSQSAHQINSHSNQSTS